MEHMPVNIKWEDQVALVPATMAIHNFNRKTDSLDDDFVEAKRNPNYGQGESEACNEDRSEGIAEDDKDEAMNKLRDNICTSIAFGRIGIRMR